MASLNDTKTALEGFKAFWLGSDYTDDADGWDSAIATYLREQAIDRAFEALRADPEFEEIAEFFGR